MSLSFMYTYIVQQKIEMSSNICGFWKGKVALGGFQISQKVFGGFKSI